MKTRRWKNFQNVLTKAKRHSRKRCTNKAEMPRFSQELIDELLELRAQGIDIIGSNDSFIRNLRIERPELTIVGPNDRWMLR